MAEKSIWEKVFRLNLKRKFFSNTISKHSSRPNIKVLVTFSTEFLIIKKENFFYYFI